MTEQVNPEQVNPGQVDCLIILQAKLKEAYITRIHAETREYEARKRMDEARKRMDEAQKRVDKAEDDIDREKFNYFSSNPFDTYEISSSLSEEKERSSEELERFSEELERFSKELERFSKELESSYSLYNKVVWEIIFL